MNDGTASAAEIVTGSLQDLDRAVLVGQRTFGKGLVQTTRPLGYNSFLKVTTAKYYIPSGRCIQAIDYSSRDEKGAVKSVPDSLVREFRTRGGRKVYDGGGIMPDERIDPEYISRFAMTLYAMGYVDDFADLYFREHGMQRIDPRTFTLTDADYERFEQFMADNSGVTVTYDPTGSGAGIEAASNGSADIGLSSRALKDEEVAGGLTGTIVALDGVAVIVNADSKVENLTVEQIGKIFTGEITDWSEVGGDAGTISCIGREAGSGTRDGFESITGTKDACKLDQELTSTGGVIEAVAGNPNAIGYASLSAVEGKNTVKDVTVGGVACTEETVLNGSYAIQRPFVLVTKTGETLSPAAQAFFDYATSSAASQLIKAAGAVPVAK